MPKKLALILGLIGLVVAGLFVLNPTKKGSLTTPFAPQLINKKAQPSETLTSYEDPSGFTISYPDNLSITKQDIADDPSTYADIQLSSKDVNGSLTLKIADSKFKTINEWVKTNNTASDSAKEAKLGDLAATEIKTKDRLFLGALDKGILFTIEIPLMEEDFWMKVYNKVLTGFSFVTPETVTQTNSDTSSGDVSFEGEEVVE